jgi:hypothetical protein
MKNPNDPMGNEPATFRLAAQCLGDVHVIMKFLMFLYIYKKN